MDPSVTVHRKKILNAETLVPVEGIRDQLGLGWCDPSEDHQLGTVTIPAAVSLIENCTGLSIFRSIWEMRVTGHDLSQCPVRLRRPPHRCIKSVQYRTSLHKQCTCWTDCPLDQICVDENGVNDICLFTISKTDKDWSCGCCDYCSGCRKVKETRIAYEAGYLNWCDVPFDLKAAINLAAVYTYDQGGDESIWESIQRLVGGKVIRC